MDGQTKTEPQGADKDQGTSAGAAQQGPDAAVLQQVEQLKAENETLQQYKGWQGEFTRARQSGLYDFVMEAAKKSGNPNAVHEEFQQLQEVQKAVAELGGLDAIREAKKFHEDIFAGTPGEAAAANTANQPPAQPAQPVPAGLTEEQAVGIFHRIRDEERQQETLDDGYSTVAEQVLTDLGIQDAGESSERRCRAMLQQEAERIAQGRSVTLDDITVAAQSVQQFLAGLRASGAQAVQDQDQKQPTVPPGMNGPGPGGQPPSKPVSEMTDEEVNALATARASKVLPQGPVGAEGLPKGWSRN